MSIPRALFWGFIVWFAVWACFVLGYVAARGQQLSDFEVVTYQIVPESRNIRPTEYSFNVTGVVRNNGDVLGGVYIRETLYDVDGGVLKSELSLKYDIPPGGTMPFADRYHLPLGIEVGDVSVQIVEVRR